MKKRYVPVFLLVFLMMSVLRVAAQNIHKHLEVFRPYAGKTWRGVFEESTPEKPMVDVSRWEFALNGQALRILHSLNNGEYGGETIVMWDPNEEALVFHYFTTAGFFTKGTLQVEGNKLFSQEAGTGNTEGITEVRSTSHIEPDGSMISKSEYLKNGEWIPGHSIRYVEDQTAEVILP